MHLFSGSDLREPKNGTLGKSALTELSTVFPLLEIHPPSGNRYPPEKNYACRNYFMILSEYYLVNYIHSLFSLFICYTSLIVFCRYAFLERD